VIDVADNYSARGLMRGDSGWISPLVVYKISAISNQYAGTEFAINQTIITF
jgi:hypothetical protein